MAKTKTKKLNPKRTPTAAAAAATSSSASTAGHTPPPKKSLKKKSKKTKKPDIAAHYDDTPSPVPTPTPSPAGAVAGASDPDMSLDSGTEAAAAAAAAAPAPDSVADSAVTLDPAAVETAAALVRAAAAAKDVEAALLRNGEERVEVDAGFIFFCSESTKLECFTSRVFGLPLGRMDLVRRIKRGAILFLYDFSVKLMYGVYQATGAGGFNLVPGAFQGRFPAQVQFDILEDCIPVHEKDFKSVIEENYDLSSRFRPDLNSRQVRKLRALFHPVPLSAIAGASARASSSAPSQARAPVSVPLRTFARQLPEQRSGYPVRAPPAIDARHGVPYGPHPVDARQGPYGPPAVDPQFGPPAVDPRWYGPPAVDPRFGPPAVDSRWYGPPAVDRRYDMQFRPPAVDNRHLQPVPHGPPAVDARHAGQYGPPAFDGPYGLQHGPPVEPRGGLQQRPPLDSQHRRQFGPPTPDMYAPPAYYSHEPPAPERQHTPAKAYPTDPYSLAALDDPYRKADERDYHAPSHGQPEHYLEPSGGVDSRPPPPIAPGRDYRSLTGQGAPQTSGGDPAYYDERAAPQYGYPAGTYEDPNRAYTAPVSSRYAFAGPAPAYR